LDREREHPAREAVEVTDAPAVDISAGAASRSLYRLLARPVQETGGPQRPPTTILTATIETIDNDQAFALLPEVTLP
jgi:hypothetical protein